MKERARVSVSDCVLGSIGLYVCGFAHVCVMYMHMYMYTQVCRLACPAHMSTAHAMSHVFMCIWPCIHETYMFMETYASPPDANS